MKSNINLSTENPKDKDSKQYKSLFPTFFWVLRDVELQENFEETPKEYLEKNL